MRGGGQERSTRNNSAAAEAPIGMARRAWGPGAGSCFHHKDGEMPLLGHTASPAAKCIYWQLLLPPGDTQGGAGCRSNRAVVSLSCTLQMGSRGNPSLLQLDKNIPFQPRHKKSATGQVLSRILAMASPTLWHCPASQKPGRAARGSDPAGEEPSHWAQAKLHCPPWPWQGRERAAVGSSLSSCLSQAGGSLAGAHWGQTRPCPLPAGSSMEQPGSSCLLL